MQEFSTMGFIAHADAFSIGALILSRLRRVTGRVIDVMYMVENKIYAKYVIDMSLATEDPELNRYALRLQSLIDQEQPKSIVQSGGSCSVESDEQNQTGATEEEIYKEQVSHHYIGALR